MLSQLLFTVHINRLGKASCRSTLLAAATSRALPATEEPLMAKEEDAAELLLPHGRTRMAL